MKKSEEEARQAEKTAKNKKILIGCAVAIVVLLGYIILF